MNTKHKHYEFIVAFAEGKGVEYRLPQWKADEWCYVNHISMFADNRYAFRLKPEPKKTVGYRRYVWKTLTGEYAVDAFVEDGETLPSDIEACKDFVKWIDNEWQYEIVEGV